MTTAPGNCTDCVTFTFRGTEGATGNKQTSTHLQNQLVPRKINCTTPAPKITRSFEVLGRGGGEGRERNRDGEVNGSSAVQHSLSIIFFHNSIPQFVFSPSLIPLKKKIYTANTSHHPAEHERWGWWAAQSQPCFWPAV